MKTILSYAKATLFITAMLLLSGAYLKYANLKKQNQELKQKLNTAISQGIKKEHNSSLECFDYYNTINYNKLKKELKRYEESNFTFSNTATTISF